MFFENIDEVDNNSVKYLSILTLIETDWCKYHKTFYTGRIIKRLISILVNEIRAKPLLLSETRHRFGVKTDICVSLDSTGSYKSLSLPLSSLSFLWLSCFFSLSVLIITSIIHWINSRINSSISDIQYLVQQTEGNWWTESSVRFETSEHSIETFISVKQFTPHLLHNIFTVIDTNDDCHIKR